MPEFHTEAITFHGWGLTPAIWNRWPEELPSGILWKHADRGYFGVPKSPRFSGAVKKRLVITHSLGLHWCPRHILDQADDLIVVSGFLSFHPKDPDLGRRSRLVFQKMISRFEETPAAVLEQFYVNTCYPSTSALQFPADLNRERMLEDLKLTGTVSMSDTGISGLSRTTILHGERDRIVPESKAEEMQRRLGRKSRYYRIRQGGHAIGFTHTDECCTFVKHRFERS